MPEVSETEQQLMDAYGFSRRSKTTAILTKYVESVGNDLTRIGKSHAPVVLYTFAQLERKIGLSAGAFEDSFFRGWFVDPRTIQVAEFAPSFVNRLAWDHKVVDLPDEKVRPNALQYYMGREIGTGRRGCLPFRGLIAYRFKNGAIYAEVASFNRKKGKGLVANAGEQIEVADNIGLLTASSLKLFTETVAK